MSCKTKRSSAAQVCRGTVLLFSVMLLFGSQELRAQWISNCVGAQRTFNADYNHVEVNKFEWGSSVRQTTPSLHSGYVVGGSDDDDFYLGLFDLDGIPTRIASIGTPQVDDGLSVIETGVGTASPGYLIVGRTSYPADPASGQPCSGLNCRFQDTEILAIRTDQNLTPLWSLIVGGLETDGASAVREFQGDGGGYIIAGHTDSYGQGNTDMYVIRLNLNGSLAWARTIGTGDFEIANDVEEYDTGSNQGFVVTGTHTTLGRSSLAVAWLAYNGTLQRDRTYQLNPAGVTCPASSCSQHGYSGKPIGSLGSHSGFIFGGYDNAQNLFAVRTDATGAIGASEWASHYTISGSDQAYEIYPVHNDQFAMCGITWNGMDLDPLLLTLDGSGNSSAARRYGNPGEDVANAMTPTSDGGFAMTGYLEWFTPLPAGLQVYDVTLLKVDCNLSLDQCQAELEVTDTELEHTILTDRFSTTPDLDNADIMVTQEIVEHEPLLRCQRDPCCADEKPTYKTKITNDLPGQAPQFTAALSVDHALEFTGHVLGGYMEPGGSCAPGSVTSWDMWMSLVDNTGTAQWQRVYGGDDEDRGWSLRQVSSTSPGENGYLLAGFSDSSPYVNTTPGRYAYAVRTDALGNQNVSPSTWSMKYGGPGSNEFHDAQQTAGGTNLIFAGYSNFPGSGPSTNMYVVNTNMVGVPQWAYTYGGNDFDRAWAVIEVLNDPGGTGFIVVGETRSFGAGAPNNRNVYVVRLDANGGILWANVYGGELDDVGYSIQEVNDNLGSGFIVAGETNSYTVTGDNYDAFAFRIEYDGQLTDDVFGSSVRHVYGQIGMNELDDQARWVIQACNDNYVLTGGYETNTLIVGNFEYATYALEIQSDGLPQWAYLYEAFLIGVTDYQGFEIIQNFVDPDLVDGSYTIGGRQSYFLDEEALCYTIGCDGRTLLNDVPCEMQDAPGYARWAGLTREVVNTTTRSSNMNTSDMYHSFDETPFTPCQMHEVACLNSTAPNKQSVIEPADAERQPETSAARGLAIELFPNPGKQGSEFTLRIAGETQEELTIQISSLLGQTVFSSNVSLGQGTQELVLDSQGWPAGSYLVRVRGNSVAVTKSLRITR